MTVDDDDTSAVYGVDFIDCLVELERRGIVPMDSLPHKCTFVSLPMTDELFHRFFEVANEDS